MIKDFLGDGSVWYHGLELYENGEPATPTLVYAERIQYFEVFVRACGIKGGKGNKRVRFISHYSGLDQLRGLGTCWAHIAFLGIDPRTYDSGSPYGFTNYGDHIWGEIERLRLRKQFRRAFYYPEWAPAYIIPNILEGERDW